MPTLKRRKTEGLAGGAGLMRYFDVDSKGPKLKPEFLIALIAVFLILEIIAGLVLRL